MGEQYEVISEFIDDYREEEQEKDPLFKHDSVQDAIDEATDGIVDDATKNIDIDDAEKVIEEAKETAKDKDKTPAVPKKYAKSSKEIFKGLKKLPRPPTTIVFLLIIIGFVLMTIKKNEDGTTRIGTIFNVVLGNKRVSGFETKNKTTKETVEDAVIDSVVSENGWLNWGLLDSVVLANKPSSVGYSK